ncbi:MAG: exosortase system-associated protein, TIGR04073 family [candidate division NC10 bacterium]|nr:exosortase system-associated protein, TIGR04073 family [candidate division NC10 bacterium]
MYRKHIVASLMVAVAVMMAAAPALAMDAGQYAAGASTKLGRGVVNTATGWGEIPMQSALGSKEDGVLGGIGGFFKGIGFAVARTLAGAFEIATFWAPVPERFEPVIQPATVFDWPTDRAFAKTGSQSASQ